MNRWLGEVPVWMRSDQVAVRQEWTRLTPRGSRGWRIVRWVLLLVGLILLATFVSLPNADDGIVPLTQRVWRVLFLVSLALQAWCSIGATLTLDTAVDTLDDALRATPQGLALWMRARWFGGMLRVRTPLMLLLSARLVMLGALLVEVTAMRGTYLDLLAQLSVDPPIPSVVLLLLVALGVVMAVVLMVAHVALDSAVGLWSSRAFGERTIRLSFQFVWIAGRLALLFGSVWLFERILANELIVGTDAMRLSYSVYSYAGEWGMSLLNVTRSADIWARVPFSVGISIVILGGMLLQVALADRLILTTIRRVERPD